MDRVGSSDSDDSISALVKSPSTSQSTIICVLSFLLYDRKDYNHNSDLHDHYYHFFSAQILVRWIQILFCLPLLPLQSTFVGFVLSVFINNKLYRILFFPLLPLYFKWQFIKMRGFTCDNFTDYLWVFFPMKHLSVDIFNVSRIKQFENVFQLNSYRIMERERERNDKFELNCVCVCVARNEGDTHSRFQT